VDDIETFLEGDVEKIALSSGCHENKAIDLYVEI